MTDLGAERIGLVLGLGDIGEPVVDGRIGLGEDVGRVHESMLAWA